MALTVLPAVGVDLLKDLLVPGDLRAEKDRPLEVTLLRVDRGVEGLADIAGLLTRLEDLAEKADRLVPRDDLLDLTEERDVRARLGEDRR